MENNNVVMFLLVIIVVLAAVFGIMFFQSLNSKEPSKVKIISNKTQYEGGKLSIQLTDLNKTPISKEKVNISITNKKDKVVVNKTVETNHEGKAKLDLDLKKGEYTVNVTYNGNERYMEDNTTQILKLGETVSNSDSSDTISLELSKFDTKVTKTVGEYKVEAEKWQGGSVGGFGVWLYKNGQLVDKDSYLSRAYFYMDGEWKWSDWGNGQGADYHKYPVSNGVEIKEIEVKF
ncbi:hypothetical protein [uncultured Methanobrevibacter sp.]|uniref:hypothetical protein n=1 Tax=uncultured Methanobrevibacter sp. TaxID=253161 RepID=UPI0025D20ACA|nr:hypothetical protein [uncultured Methanobrevibacter sp.]